MLALAVCMSLYCNDAKEQLYNGQDRCIKMRLKMQIAKECAALNGEGGKLQNASERVRNTHKDDRRCNWVGRVHKVVHN